ncbi:hypothetical protein D3C73_966870 [compost metagenome]
MRRAQAGEGRHHEHVVGIRHAGGQGFHLFRTLDDAQPIAQPLHRRARHEHAAFQHVGGLPALNARLRQAPAHGRQQVVLGLHRLVAHVHQHEAAGAVGVLRHAGGEAGLAEGGGLLVAGHACDGNRPTQPFRQGLAHDRAAGRDAGQHAARNIQQRQDLVVPILRVQIEQHRARRVAAIGAVHRAAGQLPDQPGIHRAESQLAALGHLARAGHVVQQPRELGAREIGVQHQARARLQEVGVPVVAQLVAHWRGAAVLPDDGAGKRAAGGAFPDQRGFALVGDADGGDVGGGGAGIAQRFARHVQLAVPDLAGIVFHPARPWIVLAEFTLADAAHHARAVEYDGSRAGRALVQG